MSTITLPNIRVGSDLQVRARLKDGGVAIDWSTLQNIKACIYSDAQRALAGRCAFSIDEEDSTLLVCTYAANKPQYLGVNRIVISAKYMGETKTYDKPAFSFVRWTADQEGEEITIDDPDVDVEIDVEDISSSILQEAVDAAFTAADRANDAAAAAEHMVDIHTGPEGKSAYEVAVEEGYTGTEEEWLASLKGDTGETPDISIGTVTTVAPGTPASASMAGTPEEPVLNLSIPQGVVGATPNFTVGTVTTGEPGSSVIVTITGTPEAPVLNLTIPQGMQGNTGSSVDYPYELVNNLTTNDATKGLSAAQGVVLAGQVSQLDLKVDDISTGKYYGYFSTSADLPDDATVDGFAYVGSGPTYTIYNCVGGVWTSSDITVNQSPIGNDEDIDQNEDGKLQFANRVYNAQQPNGMGYKILRKDATFASQVTETNTIFEIRYGYTLSANKTLPTGAVLLFNGGSISGTGVLTFAETTILGNAKITCGIAGTIFGQVHAEWFGMIAGDQSFDNGPIIEKVCSVFESVVIGGGDYYCSTPINLTNNVLKGFFVYGNLHYVTDNTSNAFLTFSNNKEIRIYGTVYGPVQNNTDDVDQSIGICFKDCNGSTVTVKDVRFFYTDVQILGSTDGYGNAYNTYEFCYLVAARVLLELKAESPGWVTSNRIRCNRMTSFGGYTRVETAVLIHADSVGFSDNVFEKLVIEGVTNSEPIKITNANNVAILNIRNEANYEPFIYANVAKNITVKANYGTITVRTEKGKDCYINDYLDFASYNPMENAIFIPGGSTKKLLFNATDSSKAQVINYSPLGYIPIGFIATATRRAYRITCPFVFALTVVYYDSNMSPIARDAEYMPGGKSAFQNSATIPQGYVTSTRLSVQYVAFPTLPSGCSYIGFFFNVKFAKDSYNADCPIFSVPTVLLESIQRSVFTLGPYTQHNKYGTTAQRPTFAEDYRQYLVGFEYFDTSLGKPIYASSIASDGTATWVDATGTAV